METRKSIRQLNSDADGLQRMITLIEKHGPRMMRLGGYVSKELEKYLERKIDIKTTRTKNENKSKETD
jgi:hypothetical protein